MQIQRQREIAIWCYVQINFTNHTPQRSQLLSNRECEAPIELSTYWAKQNFLEQTITCNQKVAQRYN